jgi:hypothetical protein
MNLRQIIQSRWTLVLLFAAVVAAGCAGCADEPSNTAQKPWASPEGYQNGALGNYLNQGQGR